MNFKILNKTHMKIVEETVFVFMADLLLCRANRKVMGKLALWDLVSSVVRTCLRLIVVHFNYCIPKSGEILKIVN